MQRNTFWYDWDTASPGFILRKHRAGERVTWEDVERVLAACPEATENPIIADYAEKARRGKLPKAAGRRRSGPGHILRLFFVREMVEEKLANWREARRRGLPDAPPRGRGEKSLFELAYEEVAREMRFAMSGPSLMNAISRMRKSHPYFLE